MTGARRTSDETTDLGATLSSQQRELDVLRAEREVLVGVLKTFSSPMVKDEITIRFSRLGFPGCGLDPD